VRDARTGCLTKYINHNDKYYASMHRSIRIRCSMLQLYHASVYKNDGYGRIINPRLLLSRRSLLRCFLHSILIFRGHSPSPVPVRFICTFVIVTT
jgi:hypothetical protein